MALRGDGAQLFRQLAARSDDVNAAFERDLELNFGQVIVAQIVLVEKIGELL